MSGFNLPGMWAIYRTELARTRRTVWQSVATPVITTMLYFIVFGGAIGSRMQQVGGVGYGAFIVPGLIMMTLLTQGISNASVAIYFPKFTHTIFELLSAPISSTEAVFAYIGAAATKSVVIGLIILLGVIVDTYRRRFSEIRQAVRVLRSRAGGKTDQNQENTTRAAGEDANPEPGIPNSSPRL